MYKTSSLVENIGEYRPSMVSSGQHYLILCKAFCGQSSLLKLEPLLEIARIVQACQVGSKTSLVNHQSHLFPCEQFIILTRDKQKSTSQCSIRNGHLMKLINPSCRWQTRKRRTQQRPLQCSPVSRNLGTLQSIAPPER